MCLFSATDAFMISLTKLRSN